ncbi:MAG: HAD-IG family 5'-nucleotidase [Sandaracinaceae bacterium]|nr:MAG: 5'-nucleotidase [Sandaracinaceae bacterium]HBQ14520.1 5'-nucleotidase [Myxococcales bacterium]
MQLPLPIADLPPDQAPSEVPRSSRVYVNRNLRFDLVSVVGFDMDYTLAIYRQEAMDRLSIEATARKLVEDLGYPECVRSAPFRTDFAIRGLLIDRELGNILKMDRYRYVKKAYHGMRELSREERHRHYHSRPIRVGAGRYHWVDTLYGLSEVSVFAGAIEALDGAGEVVDRGKLFDDIRRSIDLAHQDGSIIDTIAADPARFLRRDPDLPATFHKLRSAGKRLFLLTNSHAGYTDRVMTWLFEDLLEGYSSWRSFFDLIVTAAKKPRFFTHDNISFEPAEEGLAPPTRAFERGRLYQGGCLAELRRLFEASGDRVLYVGDHIYGDVLRAKKDSAWRTAMIIQEMARELEVQDEIAPLLDRMDELEAVRDLLHEELRSRQVSVRRISRALDGARDNGRSTTEMGATRAHHRKLVERIKSRLKDLDVELEELEDHVDRAYHPFWGSVFKAGPEVSLFGDQVEQYACVYTDRVSNLLHYSPLHYFRSPRDRMPHEV